jgi:DNA repair photolyase
MLRPGERRNALSVVGVDEVDGPADRVLASTARRIDNPPNPFAGHERAWLDGMEPPASLEVWEDTTRSILSSNDSPDLGFRFSINPYRGCQHACAYCYARPTHEYLSLGAGTDFDTRIHVKLRAAELLTEAFDRPSWRGDTLVFSGVTDCYQPLEASYRLTRACLEVCARYKNPVGVITKSTLIERDLDVLLELQRVARIGISVSIPFFDEAKARAIEPFVPSPARRLRVIETLARAGLDVGVMTAPIIPGLNDDDMPRVLQAAASAGARHAGWVLLRLPGSVGGVFEHRLRAAYPERADKVMARVVDTRGGSALYDSRFGARQTGHGAYADAVRALFATTTRRLGLRHLPGEGSAADERGGRDGQSRAHDGSLWSGQPSTFARPDRRRQLSLF